MSGAGTVLAIAGDVYVGDQGSGSLSVRTGSLVQSGGDGTDFFIGNAADGVGKVLVSGTGTILSAQGNLHVGYEGAGTLDIQSGASVTAGGDDALVHIGEESGSSGKVFVSGGSEGSASFSTVGELIVGDKGTGTLDVQSGGSVAVIGSDGNLEIGKDSDGTGTVLVSGAGASLVTDRTILVGEKGTGTLTVNMGGSVTVEGGTGEIEVAADGGSNGTVIIGAPSGSDPVAPGEILAGKILMFGGTSTLVFNHTATEAAPAEYSFELAAGFGPATISVEAGYTRYSGDGNPYLSDLIADGGTFQVTSALAANDIIVGRDGTGAELIVDEGAQVQLLGKLYIGEHAGSSGTVIVDGGLDVSSLLAVEQEQTNNTVPVVGYSGSGTLILSNGGKFEAKNYGDRMNLDVARDTGSTGLVVIGSPTGQAASAPGTLDIDALSFGDGEGTLLFNHSDTSGDYEFDRDIVNNGTILVEAGYTEFSGSGSSFSGTTSINGGVFAVTDKLKGTVTVNDGGTLAGTGSVSDSVAVNSGGTLAPGLSVGTLETGDISFETGSILAVEVDTEGDADRLFSEKTVTLKGGTVDVSADQYSDNASFTIVEGKDGVSGTFDAVSGSTAFIDYTLSYDSDTVTLTQSVSQSFGDVATTGNHRSVAAALDVMAIDHEVVQGLLGVETEEEARDAFDSLSGEIHASLKGVLMDGNRQISDAVNRRLAGTFSGTEATFAYGRPASNKGNAAWVSAYGGWSDIDATANTAALDNDLGGVVAGLDREVGKIWRFGLLGAYGHAKVTQTGPSASATTDSYSAGIYGAAGSGAWHVNFGGLYTWHDIDSSRTVGFGRLSETLTASYDARSWQLFAEAGYEMQVKGTSIEPFAGISFMQLDTDGYTESGGVAALTAVSDNNSTTFATLGMRAKRKLTKAATLQVMAGWRHAFGDIDPTATLAFSGGPPFIVTGAPIAQDALAVELGFDYAVSDRLTLSAGYDGQFGDGTVSNLFEGALTLRF